MPRADNEWGDWDESQFDVPPRPTWLEERLCRDKHKSKNNSTVPQLKEKPTPPLPMRKEAYLPSLRDFRCWYVWARETGRHERYLQQIEALAVAFKLETPSAEIDIHLINPNISLSEANLHNMQNDQASYQEMLKIFLKDVKSIIDSRGRSEVCEDENVLRYRSENGKYVLSYYSSLGRIIVEKNGYLLAYQQGEQVGVGDKFVTRKDAAFFKGIAIY